MINGKLVHYTPKETREAEAVIAAAWDGPKFEGPVSVHINVSGHGTYVMVEELDGLTSRLRGDLDNYAKTILDGLNGVAWVDDKQVYMLSAVKGG